MSTRAVYTFKNNRETFHIYNPRDGYPEGAIDFIKEVFEAESPRCTFSDLATSFIVANKRPHSSTELTPHYDAHIDLEYRYVITKVKREKYFEVEKGNIVVSAFEKTSACWDKPRYSLIFKGSLNEFEAFVNKIISN